MRDQDALVRALIRSKNIDVRGNCGFNPINGNDRQGINVPIHQVYYSPEKAMQSVGVSIMGTGFAGKPLRKELYYTPQKNSFMDTALLKPSLYPQIPPQEIVGRNGNERLLYAQS